MKNLSQEYEEVGGVITEDISSATHIIGVKAPAPEELIEDKVSKLFMYLYGGFIYGGFIYGGYVTSYYPIYILELELDSY